MTPPTDRPAAASASSDDAALPRATQSAATTAAAALSDAADVREDEAGPVVTVASVPVAELDAVVNNAGPVAEPVVDATPEPARTLPASEGDNVEHSRVPQSAIARLAATDPPTVEAGPASPTSGPVVPGKADGITVVATSVPDDSIMTAMPPADAVVSTSPVEVATAAPVAAPADVLITIKPAPADAGPPPASDVPPDAAEAANDCPADNGPTDDTSPDTRVDDEQKFDLAAEVVVESPRVALITPTPSTAGGKVQVAVFGKHPSHDDFYFFDDADSDPRLAWFESAVARQMRDAHPGDAPGCHDRWLLWQSRGGMTVAAAWDSRDSRGRPRTPLFACLAVEEPAGSPFVREAVAWLQALRSTLYDGELLDRTSFVAAVRAAALSAQRLEIGEAAVIDRQHVGRAANDVLRAVGLADLNAAATLFPQAGFGAKLRRAGRMLRALSGKPQADAGASGPCVAGHCRFHQDGVESAASLEGWASLAEMTRQPGPLGVIVAENGTVDLYAARPDAVDLSGVYAAPTDA